ncbi:hypothetical protein RIF29_41067 [Crotalaria pallida]|uniref:WRKY domain-containing protein n=1 Tax=Crotalaria pallida TaxID=3830 RepID=A0AAN9E6M9_CROPI
MDNYQGDLTDIIRASSGGTAYSTTTTTTTTSSSSTTATHFSHHHHHHHHHHNNHWQHHHNNFPSDPMNFSSILEGVGGTTNFGDPFSALLRDPFSTMRDPFLHELDIMPPPAVNNNNSSHYFATTATSSAAENIIISGGGGDTTTSLFGHNNIIVEDENLIMMRSSSRASSNNIFSNMIQISPKNAAAGGGGAKLPLSPYDASTSPAMVSPRAINPPAVVSGNMVNAANTTSKDCLVENTATAVAVQISSSPRNPALKRRKNQAKKVVCIPAPSAANSRQTGEVVPSDLWAWRKYGQKPIKGSPYPRGYYRCSSSKGCSARKQVERSRTDPNMLVITYTSEHNHPWPTQRNALAGSSRSQPSKNNNNAASTSKNSETSQKGTTTTTTTKPKEENQESNNSEGNVLSPVGNSVKEEIELEDIEKQLEMDDGEFSDGLSYKPSMLENSSNNNNNNNNNQSHEDFFAELGEIEADPLNLLFTHQGFNDQRESKALDPFHLFDWSGGGTNNNTNTNSSFEEPNSKRRL